MRDGEIMTDGDKLMVDGDETKMDGDGMTTDGDEMTTDKAHPPHRWNSQARIPIAEWDQVTLDSPLEGKYTRRKLYQSKIKETSFFG